MIQYMRGNGGPSTDHFQVHHIHDRASRRILIAEIWGPFQWAQSDP